MIFILCAGLFVLSMFGAGDLKLMMAMAVYMGPVKSVRILIVSLVFGAVISLLKMLKYDICKERFRYLAALCAAHTKAWSRTLYGYVAFTRKRALYQTVCCAAFFGTGSRDCCLEYG